MSSKISSDWNEAFSHLDEVTLKASILCSQRNEAGCHAKFLAKCYFSTKLLLQSKNILPPTQKYGFTFSPLQIPNKPILSF